MGGLIEPVQQWGENGNLSLEEALQRFLQTKLPAYMVPGSFQLLETLPLTVNGKVDRKALPEPRPSTPPTAPTISAPDQAQRKGVPIVEQIAGIVTHVLHLAALEPDADLLSAGANSIDIIRIVNALEREMNFRPQLIDVFRAPTIADLVRLYEISGDRGSDDDDFEEGEI